MTKLKTLAAGLAFMAGLAATPLTAQAESLPEPVQQALRDALQDERHAEAFYAAVMLKHGEVRPFRNIIRAEQRHEAMLIDTMQRYSVTVPANPYEAGAMPKPEAPATLGEACKTGIDAEIANRDLYGKKLIPAAQSYPDIVQLFEALAAASENNHLPAFQRCASR